MKTIGNLLFMVLIALIIIGIVSVKADEIKAGQQTILEEIQKRNYLDSLYMEHLSKCSFIDNESLEIGYDGYIRSKYRNGVKLPDR